ncbi:hypothetical protein [Pontibacter beigongshangensis]|uniref:hypothetical protein n=1 Tax=Pontibacter beigongshangensis TaxID=2574733 RepID=UPI00164F750F|nr:hypothetical protein [Pontibacter beigongshangensis]
MRYSSLCVLMAAILAGLAGACYGQDPIDRFKLVNRHHVILQEIDALSPMSVGNGDFAYTADVTGLQTFEKHYHEKGIPLETRTTWAWHSFPNTENLKLEEAMQESDFHGRKISYASLQHSPAGDYFRKNPHPIPMGQIGLVRQDGSPLGLNAISNIHQKLDVWQGIITSRYEIDGQPVTVETVSHPELALVAFRIKSPLLKSGKLKPAFRFPYAYDLAIKNKPPFDWAQPARHQTAIVRRARQQVLLKRTLDDSMYHIGIQWQGAAKLVQKGAHQFLLESGSTDSLVFVCSFSPDQQKQALPSFKGTKTASASSWEQFWTRGGAIDLSGSKDPRAAELERRIILSQYLMKVNYSGAFPPQETGLAHISWYGKHNSEVYWLHAAQFYQWNRTELLEKGLQWYKRILPLAKADAESSGFQGARWPKMAGPDGRPTPGTINPFIIWNHPNPIYLSELVYRAHPNKATLHQYKDLVFESAAFLASYAFYDAATDRYILGPPIKSVNESTEENNTQNPSFELAQWYHGLQVAQQWRERLGMAREPLWDDIMSKLARLTVRDGKYVEIETDPDMYKRSGSFSSAMLMALGYLPETPMVDKEVMKRTFEAILQRNGLNSFVSWSMGKGALTAARLGNQQTAVDILCNDSRQAHFHRSGYVQRPKEPMACPAYLPVNSSFLAAVALMAAGWDGAPAQHAPGFPQDGSWQVRTEGLNRLP